MKYIHLTAIVGEIEKSVLVRQDLLEEPGNKMENFFAYGATEITDQGAVELTPELGDNHILPEVFD